MINKPNAAVTDEHKRISWDFFRNYQFGDSQYYCVRQLEQLLANRDRDVEAATVMRFRKLLNRLGIHGYYSEMQKEFGDE